MSDTPPMIRVDRRPKQYPAPEFPPRKPKLFARTPPAIFPSVLGLLGLGLALRKAVGVLGISEGILGGLVEAALGGMLILWLVAVGAIVAKFARRFSTLTEDLRVLPGRTGLAAFTMSGMAAATALVPYAPGLALGLVVVSLVGHLFMAGMLVFTLQKMPAEARGVSPAMHMAFVAFVLGAVPLAQLGHLTAAQTILWITLPIAALIWGISLAQLIRTIPPAPLRPLLAIHLAPAALFTLVASQTGHALLAQSFAAFGMVIFLALLAGAKWITVSGFSPLWGAFTFPAAAFAAALLTLGGSWEVPGMVVLAIALGIVPGIAWNVLKLWPGNRLAVKTNAAEA